MAIQDREMSEYRLLAIDLDKTLLDNNHNVPPRNYDALKKCQDMGICVVLASGREVETIERFSDELEIHDPIIACVGAIVCGEKHEVCSRVEGFDSVYFVEFLYKCFPGLL